MLLKPIARQTWRRIGEVSGQQHLEREEAAEGPPVQVLPWTVGQQGLREGELSLRTNGCVNSNLRSFV